VDIQYGRTESRSRVTSWIAVAREFLPTGSTLSDEVWSRRHRGILILLWLHLPVIMTIGLVQGVGVLHTLFETSIVAMFGVGAVVLRKHRRETTIFTAMGLLTCSAVLVHLTDGLIEMHFHYFVMVGVITLYQDWWPFLVAIGYVVAQHGVAGAVSPESVYNHQSAIDHPWKWAGIHGIFVLGMSVAGILSWKLNERQLEATTDREEQLSEAQAVAHLGNWEWDVATRGSTWSSELFRLFGLDPTKVDPGFEAFLAQVHPEDRDAVVAQLQESVQSGADRTMDYRVVLAGGEVRWLHGRCTVTERNDSGMPVTVSGTAQDITDRKSVDIELRTTLSLLNATLDATADGILVVDLEGRISSFNERFAEMWQLPESVLASRDDSAALGFVLGQVVDPDGFVTKVRELYSQPAAESRDLIDFKDGRVVERYSKPQRVGGEVVGRVWSFRDITETKRLESELAHQAFHDSLTNLPNQVLFRDRVEHALTRVARQQMRLAVLFIDLDNFKTVNDSLGHTVGDQLLVAVTTRLQGCLREGDTAARMGGDEFAVLLEDLEGKDQATVIAERIIDTLRRPFAIVGKEVFIGASIGVAFDAPGARTDQLLRNADLAMYTAKVRGRGRCQLFEPAMHTAAVERLEVEADLRRACERDEFVVYYQPIVDVRSGWIGGVEALVRWEHPTRGLVPPLSFIPLAEETGLIQEIGRKVLRTACAQVRQWQLELGTVPRLSVSVNLSPRQLSDPNLLADVSSALETAGLAAESLTLEITESAMMHDTDTAVARLTELKELGVSLAVDDFGTGYSSLSYLQRFPIDSLKIDQSFVAGIDGDAEQSALARAIVRLAQTLQLNAVAEGVETESQLVRLRELGCRYAQGFFLAMPQDAESIGVVLKNAAAGGHPSAA
jgi:diguanylate cyclase (GGDEF)-like protein/PAS domain S-box-containing protein